MPSSKVYNKNVRFSIVVSSELFKEVHKISKQTNKPVSEIIRKSHQNYINQTKNEEMDNELEAGYKANYKYFLKSQREWKFADYE